MANFTGVTPEVCQRAFAVVEPAISRAAQDKVINKYAGCLLVLDPNIPYESKYQNAMEDGLVDDLILWRTTIDDDQHRDLRKYLEIAKAKAFTSFCTGLPSRKVQMISPFLYRPGMTKWGGSTVIGTGPMKLVIAFSGVEEEYDEMIAEMLGSVITGILRNEMKDVMASDEAMILSPAQADI